MPAPIKIPPMTTQKPSKKTRSKPATAQSQLLSKTPASDYLASLGTSGTDPSEESAVALLISTHQDIREHYMKLLSDRLDLNKKIEDLEIDVKELEENYQDMLDEFYAISDVLDVYETEQAQLPKWYKWLTGKIEPFLLKHQKGNDDYNPYFD